MGSAAWTVRAARKLASVRTEERRTARWVVAMGNRGLRPRVARGHEGSNGGREKIHRMGGEKLGASEEDGRMKEAGVFRKR